MIQFTQFLLKLRWYWICREKSVWCLAEPMFGLDMSALFWSFSLHWFGLSTKTFDSQSTQNNPAPCFFYVWMKLSCRRTHWLDHQCITFWNKRLSHHVDSSAVHASVGFLRPEENGELHVVVSKCTPAFYSTQISYLSFRSKVTPFSYWANIHAHIYHLSLAGTTRCCHSGVL